MGYFTHSHNSHCRARGRLDMEWRAHARQASERSMSYQHIQPPAGRVQKITVNADFTLNVPDAPIVPVQRRRGRRGHYSRHDGGGGRRRGQVLTATAAAFIGWKSTRAKRATQLYGPQDWPAAGDPAGGARLCRIDQGPAGGSLRTDGTVRSLNVALRQEPGSVRLFASRALFPRRCPRGCASRKRPIWSSSAKLRRYLRGR